MWKIFIDAKTRDKKTVILLKDLKEVAKKEGERDIVTAIKEILDENGLALSQIASFNFAQGAGSFTGVKTGAAIANILSWAVKGTPYEKLPMPQYGGEPNIEPSFTRSPISSK